MDFSRKKLQQNGALNLRICPVDSVSPYALMLAPVYVYMKDNGKYVSVKAPLDFFSPEELEKWKPFESFYLPAFVDASLIFREAGRQVKALLSWQASASASDELPPAPYEISDAVIRALAPLWTEHLRVEPFFVAVFAGEICNLLPASIVVKARDRDVTRFELAVLRSSWAIFLALHLGYCDLQFLGSLRLTVFGATLSRKRAQLPGAELQELVDLVEETIDSVEVQSLGSSLFERLGRVPAKIAARLERVRDELAKPGIEPRSIRGPGGFLDG